SRVAAVAGLAVPGVLAVGLARTTVLDQRLTENALAALQADALARSGVAAAAVILDATTAVSDVDTLASPWTRSSGRQPLGAGWLEVRVEDEARRLDVRSPALPRLLALLDLDAGVADAIADWTDADAIPRPGGAERDWYLGRTPRLVPRDGPLATLGELALVRGLDRAAVARLRPHLTVAGEAGVNPNTASREV